MRAGCAARRFMIAGGVLLAYAMCDGLTCIVTRSTASVHSWQALSAFSALGVGFVSCTAAFARMGTATLTDRRPPKIRAPKAPPAPAAMSRRDPPNCWSCSLQEAVSRAQRERIRYFAPISTHSRPLYDLHRDCWVTTGNEGELRRMLRHVTWEAS